MSRSKASRTLLAGEPRGEFGTALDQLLPQPELRRKFRAWRHTRPFWGGVLVILAGIVIISYPLGPWPAVMAIGAAALTGITIGLILVIGGLFFWFAPHQRMFVSIVLMLCSVLSLVVSNLGGFFLGMILGMLGSSMGFGWKQPRSRAPSPQPRGTSATDKAAALVAVGALAASILGLGMSQSPALAASMAAEGERPEGRPPLPAVACGTTNVTTGTLQATNVWLRGTEKITDGCGNTIEVVDLFIEDAVLTDYTVTSPGGTFKIETDLHIERIELETPRLNAHVDVGNLVAEQLGLPVPLPELPVGPVPITPELVGTLDSLGLLSGDGFRINSLNAAPANWIQPIIRGGDVTLRDARLQIVGGPPAH